MLTVSFFQAHAEAQRQLKARFKERGFDLKAKRALMHDVLGFTPKMNDMTISEMEQVIRHLDQETEDKEETAHV